MQSTFLSGETSLHRKPAASKASRRSVQVHAAAPPPAWPGRVVVPEVTKKRDGPKVRAGPPGGVAMGLGKVGRQVCCAVQRERRLRELSSEDRRQAAGGRRAREAGRRGLTERRPPARPRRRPPAAEVLAAGLHRLHRHPDAGHCGGEPRQV